MKPKRPEYIVDPKPPVVKFRVHPLNETLYFDVLVFDTWSDMHKYGVLREFNLLGVVDRKMFGAKCFPITSYRSNGKLSPHLGEIIFYKEYIPPNIVCHEMLHGAIWWSKRKKINPMDDSEETKIKGQTHEEWFVRAQDSMVKQFFKKIEGKL